MIGMEVGKKHRIHIGATAAGGLQALGDTRATVDEIGAALVAHDLRGAEPPCINLRAAGAEKGQKHGATLLIGRGQNKARFA